MTTETKTKQQTAQELSDTFARMDIWALDQDHAWYEARWKENPHKLPATLEEWLASFSLTMDEMENDNGYAIVEPLAFHSRMVSTKDENVEYTTGQGWTRLVLVKVDDALVLGWEVDDNEDMENGEFNVEFAERLVTIENVHRVMEKWRAWVFREFEYGEGK